MTAPQKLERYVVRGDVVYDRQDKRPVSVHELAAAMNFYALVFVQLKELKTKGIIGSVEEISDDQA